MKDRFSKDIELFSINNRSCDEKKENDIVKEIAKGKKIKPDRIKHYTQLKFLLKHSLKNTLKDIFNPMSLGFCSALTRTWYDYKREEKDLIDELNKFHPHKDLILKIKNMQNKSSFDVPPTDSKLLTKLGFYRKPEIELPLYIRVILDLEEKGYYSSPTFLANESRSQSATLFPNDPELPAPIDDPVASMQASGEFSDAMQDTYSITQYFTHLTKLTEPRRCTGFHFINVGQLENLYFHAIGWTYDQRSKEYVLFDPNYGEFGFKEYNQFKSFICYYIENLYENMPFCKKGNHIFINAADFYHSEELQAFKVRKV